mmetsp:Transcript_55040/g.129190  ORF Transcript_55040/g.129190 Transcript_55040/m.129190 type:complete len:300 (-) Transcript_55040:245-1144(-)
MGTWGAAGLEVWTRDAEAAKRPLERSITGGASLDCPPETVSRQVSLGSASVTSKDSPGLLADQKEELNLRRFENAVWRLKQKDKRTFEESSEDCLRKAAAAIGKELEFRGPNTKSNSGGEVSLCLPEPLGGPTISRKRRSLEKRAVTFPNPPGGVLDVQRLENAMWRLWRRENRKRAWQPWYSALPEEGQKASKQIGSQIDFPQVRQLLHKQDLFNMRNLALHLAQRSSEGSVEAGQSTEIPSTPRSTTSTQLEFQEIVKPVEKAQRQEWHTAAMPWACTLGCAVIVASAFRFGRTKVM